MSSSVEVVDRSFYCGLKVSFCFNEADVCKAGGARSCLGRVSWCCLSGRLCYAALSTGRCIREFERNSRMQFRANSKNDTS